MNLFRSEEHARRWSGFDAEWAHTMLPVARWGEIFSGEMFRQRGRADYISWLRSDDGRAAMMALRAALPQPPTAGGS
ncbi:MAG: hypothetical protein OEY23_20835 [Acidimicrobiia bacterium]|nr:hypothetical protein [Acidimicrobiia bacterium]